MNRVKPAFVLIAAAITLAGCDGSPSRVHEAPTAASPTAAATVPVPTETQLKSGLLTEAEIGAPFKADTPADTPTESGRASGCEELANSMNDTSTTPGQVTVSADFTTGDEFPVTIFTQALSAEPEASFERSLKETTDAIASCKQLTLSYNDGTTLSFDLSPINFTEGATAARLDGTFEGTFPLNGYIAVQRISRNVAMLFMYMQTGSSSSQGASHIYTLAADKAKRAFP